MITAQIIALTDEVTAIQLRGRRMAAAVLIVHVLGGGWTAAKLPSPADVTTRGDPAPGVLDLPIAHRYDPGKTWNR